jgi:NADH-quinone oxidoreductase subunit N
MTHGDILALLPLIVVGYGAALLLVVGTFWRSSTGMALGALISLAGGFGAIFLPLPSAPRNVTPLLRIDAFALFYIGLFFAAGAALTIIAHDYLGDRAGSEKFYGLLLLATLGMGTLAASNHFAIFFIALEAVSVSLYGLIGYTFERPASLEASLKYLVLAGVAAAFLLFGMALIYFEFGTMEFGALAAGIAHGRLSALPLMGVALMLVGFGFKLAVAPFHAWAPDVYQGAPAPVTGLIATGSKAAMLALLLRFLYALGLSSQGAVLLALTVLSILTMSVGNLLALLQRNIKRLLAYSSIANMGYLLIPLAAGNIVGASAVGFYLVSYFATTIGAFGVIAALSGPEREADELEQYRGLGFRRRLPGATLGLMMLSLAGVPPTMGFMAKFYIFAAAAHSGLWLLLIVGLLNAGMAIYYYLRVLVALYATPAEPAAGVLRQARPTAIALGALAAIVIFFGLYPTPLMNLSHRAAATWWGGFARQESQAAPPRMTGAEESRCRIPARSRTAGDGTNW